MSFIYTVDVEDWYQVENLRPSFPRDTWLNCESRVEDAVQRLLELCAEKEVKGTFFILGWIAKRHPQLVQAIAAGGHEVACHGFNHDMLTVMNEAAIRRDIAAAKALLEDSCGVSVTGFRAPNFSITNPALDILADLGFEYDSSLFPFARHDRYGKIDTSRFERLGANIYRYKNNGLLEFVLPIRRIRRVDLPWAGGGDDVRPVELYHQVNVVGAQNTCEIAEQLHIHRLIFTSTVAVYGLPDGVADETTATLPFNEHGRTKLEAEQVFRAWARRAPERSLTIVRPTVVFGPGNRGNVYLLLQQIASGRSIVIGDGRNRKSMAYVGNLAEFLVHALGFAPGIHLYNYVDQPDPDMNGLVAVAGQTLGRGRLVRIPYALGIAAGAVGDWLARLTGRHFPISRVRVRKYTANTRFAAERIASTGFTPRHSLHDALVTTIRHEFTDADRFLQGMPGQDPVPARRLDR